MTGRLDWINDRWPIPVLVILAVIVVFFGYRLWYADQLRVRIADGYCPMGTRPQLQEQIEVPGHTVILIDTSNEILEEDGEAAFERIDALVRDTLQVPFLQKLSIYGLPESEDEIPRQTGRSWCIPKQGAMANVLYENPRVVEIEFRRFLQNMGAVFDELVDREEADSSPIVETLTYLVQHHEDLDSFIIVSDMLQHSSIWSDYGDVEPTSEDVRRECTKIRQSERLKAVFVYYIDRRLEVQGAMWPTLRWEECLGDVVASLLN